MSEKKQRTPHTPFGINRTLQHALVTFVTLLYALTFPIMYGKLGGAWSALAILPVGVAAFVFGLRGSILASFLGILLNTILFYAVGENGIQLVITGGLAGASAILMTGLTIGWLSSILDKLRVQSRELSIARDQALEATRLRSELLSKVSHDLRTPLGAILGYAELIELGTYGSVSKQQKEKLDLIIDSTKELSSLVNDLLDMSRIEGKGIKLDISPINLEKFVSEIRESLEFSAQKEDILLTCKVDPALPEFIQNDSLRLSQVLVNLVDNAIKYTDKGNVNILFSKKDTDQMMLQVQDTGIGIPVAEQEHIFESFRQGNYGEPTARKGVGLGLSIVKELVALMGGEINVKSQVGKGTTFSVILPITIQEEKIS